MRKTVIQLSAMLAFAAAAAGPALAAPTPGPTPEQEQQYRQLQSEYGPPAASYEALGEQFDSGRLTWRQYQDGVAKLNTAGGPLSAASGQSLALPDSMTPPLHVCTADHKFAEWPVHIQFSRDDLGRLGTGGPNGEPAANIANLIDRVTSEIESTLQGSFAHAADKQNAAAIASPASDQIRTAMLAKLKQQIADAYKLTVTFDSRPLAVNDDPVCSVTPPAPAPAAP